METPESLIDLAWGHLMKACTQRKHPFHSPSLATMSARGPETRTVVLRQADNANWELRANADYRSPKVAQLLSDPRSSWHFYSAPDHLQVRCFGRTHVHHLDTIAREAWERSQLLSRRCYLAPIAPSVEMSEIHPNLPPELIGREPTEAEAEPGFENFAVMRCEILEMDVLSLRYEGNVRAVGKPNSTPIWLAP